MTSSNSFSELIDAVADALIIVDQQSRILWCNQKVTHILGYNVEEILEKSLDMLLPKELREAHAMFIGRYFSHPVSRPMGYSRPLRALTKSGKTIKVSIALSPIEWNRTHCAVATLRCHHSEQETTATLESVKDLFNESQSIAHVGAWDWDVQSNTLHWSEQIFHIFGLAPYLESPSYDTFISLIHPEDRVSVEAAIEDALTSDTPYLISHRVTRQDDSVRHVIERGRVYRNKAGEPIRMIGTVQDVTDDYNYHMQLKIADSVFKHAFDGAISTDNQLHIIRANPAFERMSSYRAQELEKQSLTKIIPGLKSSTIMDAVHKAGYWHGVLQCHDAEGDIFPAHLSISKIDDEAGPGIKFYVVTLTDISSIKLHEKQLQKLAYYDSLTSLFNRSYFIQKASALIKQSKRDNKGLAILFIDLDGFKEVNDTQGHQEGDRILTNIATKLDSLMQRDDLLSRFGGDEFVVLQQTNDRDSINELATSILRALTVTCDYGIYSYRITASIGIALYPQHGRNELELIKKADIAMYKAKYAGKNQFMFYVEEYGREKTDRLKLISDLDKAIQLDQIALFLQPIVMSRNESPSYFEALARWEHSEASPIPPSEFIPIAEETGLIIPLGKNLLSKVRLFMDQWYERQGKDVSVSFNLSVSQLYAPDLIQTVTEIFQSNRNLYKNLVFEITESSVMNQLDEARTELLKLKKLGCAIAIDDFGTGYSSLSYLSRLPIDVVKIDRSFVQNISERAENGSICRAIVSLSHALKLDVIAEGIETIKEYLELKDMNCDKVQGYLFGRPSPVQVIIDNIPDKKTASRS